MLKLSVFTDRLPLCDCGIVKLLTFKFIVEKLCFI